MAVTGEASGGKNRDTIVVDLGSKSAKQIKKLRKGKGKLMDKVHECVNELKNSGTINGAVQPVVIVVKEKTTIGKSMLDMIGMSQRSPADKQRPRPLTLIQRTISAVI